ncbi:serine protease [Daedaleopsis nitida]|nr:serine protease [Daedaleopsis nitida]
MRSFFTTITAALALLAPVFAAPSIELAPLLHSGGETKPDSYIVKLKDHVSKDGHLDWLSRHHGPSVEVTYREWNSQVLHGYAGILNADALYALRQSADVEYIEKDGYMYATVTQSGAPWGLQRISQRPKLPSGSNPNTLNYNYTYTASGLGIPVYVIDTGINIAHVQFGGRARWGATFGGYNNADGNGHGTHCAGTVGSAAYGVAKGVNLFAVKVLSDQGSGTYADVISGMNFVAQQVSGGNTIIASMSLGGPASDAVDSALNSASAMGVAFAVAAGNDGVDARNTSPARAASAITVGATDINDSRAGFSNYGSVVNIFAPGVGVISTWIGSNTAINSISGTSMATPHIAGLLATLLQANRMMTPSQLATGLQRLATPNAISGVPSGTVNLFAYNGASG